jgi:hypothetical protein
MFPPNRRCSFRRSALRVKGSGWCGGSCCGTPARKPNKISAVAVLRLDAGGRCVTGTASDQQGGPRTRPLFDMRKCGGIVFR